MNTRDEQLVALTVDTIMEKLAASLQQSQAAAFSPKKESRAPKRDVVDEANKATRGWDDERSRVSRGFREADAGHPHQDEGVRSVSGATRTMLTSRERARDAGWPGRKRPRAGERLLDGRSYSLPGSGTTLAWEKK